MNFEAGAIFILIVGLLGVGRYVLHLVTRPKYVLDPLTDFQLNNPVILGVMIGNRWIRMIVDEATVRALEAKKLTSLQTSYNGPYIVHDSVMFDISNGRNLKEGFAALEIEKHLFSAIQLGSLDIERFDSERLKHFGISKDAMDLLQAFLK